VPARTLGEDLVEGMLDAVVLIDDQFGIRWVNRALEQHWGVERGAITGKVLWDVFPHAIGTPQYHEITRAMRTREPTEFEAYSKPSRMWIEVHVRPSGAGLVIQVRDTTRRKRNETLLRGERKALEMAMHDAPLADTLDVLVRTLELCTDDESMASILLARDGKLYCGAAPHLPPAYNAAIEGLVIGPSSGSCGTAAFTGELVIAKDLRNDPKWADFKALAEEHHLGSCWSWPIRSNAGKVLATFALYTREPSEGPSIDQLEIVKLLSITAGLVIERQLEAEAKAKADRELAAANIAAERANRAKDEFLAMLGHELRNPLAPIVSALQLMDLRSDEASRSARAVIARQVDHLVHLVDDMLDVSRIATGRITLHEEILDVAAVVARAIEMTQPQFEHRQQKLVSSVEPGLHVRGDATRLAQVICNLLTNAAKYSDRGTTTTLSASATGERVSIRVQDQGIGIAPEMLPRVFELYTQAEEARGRDEGGLGLGLAIVRNLVRMHGGEVRVTSPGLGKGSTFEIELPLAHATAAATRANQGKHAAATRVPRRVLVVDDNIDIADMMAEVLAEAGHDVRVANDGAAALSSLDGFTPEAVLLDIGLPGMDGFEVARELRNRGAGAFLVAITGYGAQTDRDRSKDAGFDAHLLKPVKVDAVLQLLDRLAE